MDSFLKSAVLIRETSATLSYERRFRPYEDHIQT
jgi:hypothetical protein